MLKENSPFIYRMHPDHSGSYQIFLEDGGEETHVADYLLQDENEKEIITEQTVQNIVTLINFESDLIDMTGQVNTRLYFQRKPPIESGWHCVLFRTNNGRGTIDNAFFTYDPEEIDITLLSTLCGTRDGNSGGFAPRVSTATSVAPSFDPSFDN